VTSLVVTVSVATPVAPIDRLNAVLDELARGVKPL
jgi:hypothetical protein